MTTRDFRRELPRPAVQRALAFERTRMAHPEPVYGARRLVAETAVFLGTIGVVAALFLVHG